MKKLGKILLVTLSILVSVILIEYIHSQRWRLQKPADVSEYEELIVGEWEQDTKKYYLMDHLLDLTVEKKYLKIKSNFNYEVYSKPRMISLIKNKQLEYQRTFCSRKKNTTPTPILFFSLTKMFLCLTNLMMTYSFSKSQEKKYITEAHKNTRDGCFLISLKKVKRKSKLLLFANKQENH